MPTMPSSRKLCLIVVDSLRTDMLLRAVADDLAPNFAALLERGALIGDCVSAFPSVTPVACSEIATGVGPDRHGISGMNWYHRAEQRYVEYGSSLEATRAFGLFRTLYDTVYNMNMAHLSHEVETVFERLGDAGVRTAVTPFLIYRGRRRHELSLEGLMRRVAVAAKFRHAVWGPDELFYGELYASRRVPCKPTLARPGTRDSTRPASGRELVREDLYDFLLFSLPDNDHHTHTHGVDAMLDSIAHADRSFGEIVDEAGGIDAFLDAHAVILMADHAQTDVESGRAAGGGAGRGVARAGGERRAARVGGACGEPDRAGGGRLPAGRGRTPGGAPTPAVRARLRGLDGVDLVAWLASDNGSGPEAVVETRARRAALSPRLAAVRPARRGLGRRGRARARSPRACATARWTTPSIPTAWRACGRRSRPRTRAICWSPWSRATSAWTGAGRRTSAAAATARSLAGDSLGPLVLCGLEPGVEEAREQWALRDVAGLVLDHFGVGAASQHRRRALADRAELEVATVRQVEEARARARRRRSVATERARDATARAADWTWQLALRIHLGTRKPENWVQLFKFGLVGGTGYVINLAVFAVLDQAFGVHHIPAAVGAFCVAVTNNFLWNRHWTFRAADGHAGFQAARFFTVSVLAWAST